MKTSDVLNIGYGRVYSAGRFSSRFDEAGPRTGASFNKLKMMKEDEQYVIRDFIKFDQDTNSRPDLESELKVVAFNEKFCIAIRLSTPLGQSVKTELALLTEINRINQDGNSCASSYHPESNSIETSAYISFVGYGIQDESEEGTNQDEEITFSSSPEIEGFMNLMFQVINRAYGITIGISTAPIAEIR